MNPVRHSISTSAIPFSTGKKSPSFQESIIKNIYKYFSEQIFASFQQENRENFLEFVTPTKIGLGIALASCTYAYICSGSAPTVGNSDLTVSSGFSSHGFFQNPDLLASISLGLLALPTSFSYSPCLGPFLPENAEQQIGLFLRKNNNDYLKIAKNIFVYGVNSLASGNFLFQGFQHKFIPKVDVEYLSPRLESSSSTQQPQKLRRSVSLASLNTKNEVGTRETLDKTQNVWSNFLEQSQGIKKRCVSFISDLFGALDRFFSLPVAAAVDVNSLRGDWIQEESLEDLKEQLGKCSSTSCEKSFSLFTESKKEDSLTNKEFAQVLADPYIGGTDLEGMNLEDLLKLLHKLSKHLPKPLRNEIEAFSQKIQRINSSFSTAKFARTIQNLQPGEDAWLEGGWRSKGGGHLLLYQWVKTPENTYDIYIYNLGAGLHYHHQERRKDVVLSDPFADRQVAESMSEKMYFSPFVKFEGVLPEEIGVSQNTPPNRFLFKKLMDALKSAELGDKSGEIYLETFGALNHRRMQEPQKREDDILAFKHFSGTCGWFTLVYAALRKHFPDKELWEKMDFQRNQRAFYLHCKSPTTFSSDAERRELCLQGGKNLLLQLAGLQDTLLTQSQVEIYRKPIHEVLELLKEPSPARWSIFHPIDYTDPATRQLALGPWTPKEPSRVQSQQVVPFFSDFLNVEKIEHLNSELTNILTSHQNSYGYDIPIQIERFVQSLPNPRKFSEFWRDSTEIQTKECIALVSKIFDVYASKVLHDPGRILAEQTTAWGLLALIHHFSTKLNDNLKYNYGIFYDSLLKIKSNPIFVMFSLKDFKFYEDVLYYFQNLEAKPKLFQAPSSSVSFVNGWRSVHNDVLFLDAVVSNDTKLREKMAQKQEEWKTYRKKFSDLKETTELVDRSLILLLNDDIFVDGEYEYLAYLRKAAYLAQAFTRRISEDFINCHKNIYGTYINGWYVKNPIISDAMHLVPDEQKSFQYSGIDPNHPTNCLLSTSENSEENKEVLKKSNTSSRLRSLSCHPSLKSDLIIEYFSNNIQELSKIENQNTLLLSLFQLPVQEAVQNPDFIASVSEFVEKGLTFFFRLRDDYEKPDIKTTLFFIQIARRIKELHPACDLRDYTLDINHLLGRNDLTNEEIQLLHMHRILQYRVKKDVLNNLNSNSLNKVNFIKNILIKGLSYLRTTDRLNDLKIEEANAILGLKEIIASWIYLSSYKCLSWHAFYSQSEAVRFIYDLAPILRNLSLEFLTDLINDLVPGSTRVLNLGEKNTTAGLYELSSADENWSINIPHGKVLCNNEVIQLKAGEDLALYSSYIRVFGHQRFSFTQVGDSLVFTGPGNNLFRIFKKGNDLVIQMQFQGEWYEYLIGNGKDLMISAAKALKDVIPKPLLADHFIFRSSTKILFVHKNTFSVDYVDFTEEANETKAVLLASSDQHFYKQMGRFEDRSWILEKKYPDNSIRIELPRFRSTRGEPLGFTKNKLGLSWDSNPRYVLHNATDAFLGRCSNYLYLTDNHQKKLLVPCKPVASSKKFAPHCDLDIQDVLREAEYLSHRLQSSLYTGETNSPQERIHLFLEYDIQDKKVLPLSPEGGIFLSYLFLAQKEYLKAFQALQDVFHLKNQMILSEDSKKILSWIFKHPISSYDRSPSAAAIALKALLAAKKEGKGWLLANKQELWMNYLNGIDYVQAELRLSLEERKAIEDIVGSISEPAVESNWCKEVDEVSIVHMKKFEKVFLDFINAETLGEKVFINLKNYKYLKLRDKTFTLALDAARKVDGLKKSFSLPSLMTPLEIPYSYQSLPVYSPTYLDFPLSEEMKDVFLSIENTPYPNEDILLMRCPEKKEGLSKRKEEPFIRRSLSESLRLTNVDMPLKSFPLPSLEISINDDLEFFAKQFLQRKNVPISRAKVDLEEALQRPVSGNYQTAIESERKFFLEDYQKAIAKNQNTVQFSLIPGKNFHDLLERRLKQFRLKSSPQKMLDLANRLPNNPKQKTLTLLLTEGGAKARITVDQLIDCFLAGNAESYWALNPHLTQDEIIELDKLVKDFLVYSIHVTQGEKALNNNDFQEKGEILFSTNAYKAPEYQEFVRQFLVYEYRSGLRMRHDQTSLIRQMSLEDHSVAQLMMGGGKTTVLASNLLYLAAKPGRIAFFIPPQAQFSTVAENLSNMQRKHFNQEVIPIRMKRDELTIKNLRRIKEQFEKAKTSRKIILTTRETIESLTLEYLDYLNKGVESDEKLQILSHLIKEIKNLGDVLVDEVDVILNPMQETNFPFGKKIPIESSLVDMTRDLFALLASLEFDSKIRLRTNRQALLSKSECEFILAEVMRKFFDQYQDLDLDLLSKEAILRFILEGKLDSPLETLGSGISERVLEKIALLKHLTKDILPHTFSKSTGENYGRVLDKSIVGPYHGVGSPSFTEFGSPWEAMVYHFQTVLSRGVSASQIEDCYNTFLVSARYSAFIKKISLEATEEAQAFKKLFGFKLSEFSAPKHMQDVLEKVNADLNLQLFLEANTIAQTVGYYITYLRSTPQDFVSSFARFDSFSGTPWNIEAFPQPLQDHFYQDLGVQGRIIDTFLQRRSTNPLKIHEANSASPQELLAQALQEMSLERRERVTGFIDTGGIFKDSNGFTVAQEFLKFYESNPRIQTVLFFHRPTPSSPEVLMALKKGSITPIILGSSQSEEIAKFGISPDSTFVYYDQTHCEATDILQPDHAINMISVSHQTTIRTFLQGILRLRSYFKNQDVEVILPKQEIHQFKEDNSNSLTYNDIIVKLIDNQAIRKADQVFRSYSQKIDSALRNSILEKIVKSESIQREINLFRIYKSILIQERDQKLYSRFGFPEVSIDSLEGLKKYAKQKVPLERGLFIDHYIKKEFVHVPKNGSTASNLRSIPKIFKFPTRLELGLRSIVQSAQDSLYLPKTSRKISTENLGLEQEIALALQEEHSLTQEIERELSSHQNIESFQAAAEVDWNPSYFTKGFQVTKYDSQTFHDEKELHSIRLYSLKDVMSDKMYTKYMKNYSHLFDKDLLVSRNFLNTRIGSNSLFDEKNKYAGQILVVLEKGVYKAILISLKEAVWFKEYMKKNRPNYLWLVQPSGHSFLPNSLKLSTPLKKMIWEINLFNGNVEALINDQNTPVMLQNLDLNLVYDFLAMKTAFNSKEKELFYTYFVPNFINK